MSQPRGRERLIAGSIQGWGAPYRIPPPPLLKSTRLTINGTHFGCKFGVLSYVYTHEPTAIMSISTDVGNRGRGTFVKFPYFSPVCWRVLESGRGTLL